MPWTLLEEAADTTEGAPTEGGVPAFKGTFFSKMEVF